MPFDESTTAIEIDRLRARIEALERDATMPKYLYHSPLDYHQETHAPLYDEAIFMEGEPLAIPPPRCRPGYAPDDDQRYLEWGRDDHDLIVDVVKNNHGLHEGMDILDWGCSSGRVLRHFYHEHRGLGWRLHGTDIQAYLVEWMRRNFPDSFDVVTGSTLPHLPFRDGSMDVIYGFSVFTHTKYLWDAWLAEFRRVLRPGGLCIQTVQCENAWRFYHENRHEAWVRDGHPESMLETPEMLDDFFFYGDAFCSQTFYREETVRKYWGRYLDVVDFFLPQKHHYQNVIVLRNRSDRAR